MFQYLNERRAKSKRRNTIAADVPSAKRSFRSRKPIGLTVSALSSAISWGSAPSTPLVTITPLVASPTFSYVANPSAHRYRSSLCLTSPPSSSIYIPRFRRSSTSDLHLSSGSTSASSSKTMDDYFTFPPIDDAGIMLDDWTRVEEIDGDLEADLEMEGYDELLVNGVKI